MNIRFDNKCIRCGSTAIDTTFRVTVETAHYEVGLCAEHAENTTAKLAKEYVVARIAEAKELLAKVQELGLDINTSAGGIAVATNKPKPRVESAPEEEKEEKDEAQPVATSQPQGTIKRKLAGGVSITSVSGVSLESHTAVDPEQAMQNEVATAKSRGMKVSLPKVQSVEEQQFRAPSGRPITVPKTIKHDTGTTRIAIVDTGGNSALQKRFKAVAEWSETAKEPHRGYADVSRPCVPCAGTGFSKINNEVCTKCKGTGQR